MNANIENREIVLSALKKELVGPSPAGEAIETKQNILYFQKPEDAYGPFVDKETGEEILQRDAPTKRYGVGVLHPFGTPDGDEPKQEDVMGLQVQASEVGFGEEQPIDSITKKADAAFENIANITSDNNSTDLDLTLANTYKPSSIGISFLAQFPPESQLIVEAIGGRYKKFEVQIANQQPRSWWVREAISLKVAFLGENILKAKSKLIQPDTKEPHNLEGMDLRVELYTHPFSKGEHDQRLVTICLVNRSQESTTETTLFQTHFKLYVLTPGGGNFILPYPGPELSSLDDEEKSMALLYRHELTFGVGHGCAAMWDYKSRDQKTAYLSAECLPSIETPSITPDILDEYGQELRVPMAPLAGLVEKNDGYSLLEKLVKSYEDWIEKRAKEVQSLRGVLQETGYRHVQDCQYCAKRMRNGLLFLKSNPLVFRAFELANRAILFQQIHSLPQVRRWYFDEKNKKVSFSEPYIKPDPLATNSSKGFWRAFQIAFLLATVESVANAESPERDIVELIWFPTGGGKTEAYLGLTAFSLLLRRLRDKNDDGVDVLMRYTLRLLTTQQFTRASRLICALEQIRKENVGELGNKEFSIGLWVGGSNTPNTRKEALDILKGLEKGDKHTDNKFVLDRCPWCSAQIGPLDDEQSKKSKIYVVGYSRIGNSVGFKCSDRACEFSTRLPIYVTDEEIYENPPSMIIGTVDKFAMLTWKPAARALFGIGNDGGRVRTPPGLIIQDELHLISGPLGSVVGLYEALIDELCTDRRTNKPVRPKIISSTATIRRYQEQIKSLYSRAKACLFPPPGIDVNDSFFSKYATNKDQALEPGRVYVGVHAPGLGSTQTVQVRTFTPLLQAPIELPESERDPWWTLLLFFNSLRELGTTLSLLQSDIPDYQQVYINRIPKSKRNGRFFSEIVELTGRASSDDVPRAISALEKRYTGQSQQKPIDVCLASNILEVGVDIERLALMAVVGQPKTTSQYIQVTGRVGRNWRERPGMIVTLYSASKPRDRSHFEKFVSYHQKLYSQVEPTSVTPFSAPVLDRALHAVMIAYIRQMGNDDAKPDPYPELLISQLKDLLLPRIQAVDPDEIGSFERIFERRARQWKKMRPISWEPELGNNDDLPLMKVAGTFFEQTHGELPLPTMQSMRSVDAECVAEIRLPTIEGVSDDA